MSNIVNKPNGTGIRRLLKATQCSNRGLLVAFKNESAFRQELLLGILLVPLSFVIATNLIHWFVLMGSILLLLIVELINSAIEATCDAITLEHNELIKNAKDIGSAAVFITVVFLSVTWLTSIFNLFFPKL